MRSVYVPAIPDEDCQARGHEFGITDVNDLEAVRFCMNCSRAWSMAFDSAFERTTFVTPEGKMEVAVRAADLLLVEWRKDGAPE